MGKGKKLKTTEVTDDFQKFEDFFFQDARVFGIITCIADSMAESGISFTHQDMGIMLQSNDLASEYELNTLISELTIANMVFGNSFPVIDPDNSEFNFSEQLSPISLSINNENGRHAGWKFSEGQTNTTLTREQVIYIPINRALRFNMGHIASAAPDKNTRHQGEYRGQPECTRLALPRSEICVSPG